MLPSTKRLLNDANTVFQMLGYKYSFGDDELSSFLKTGFDVLNHIDNFENATKAIRYIQFALDNYSKIEKAIRRHPDYWDEAQRSKRYKKFPRQSDDDVAGIFYITNAINNGVYLSGAALKADVCGIEGSIRMDWKGGFCFHAGEDDAPEYYLRFSRLDSTKMWLLDKNKDKIGKISFGDDLEMIIEKNKTDYCVQTDIDKLVVGVYKKDKVGLLKGEDDDLDNASAMIIWDAVYEDEKDLSSLAQLFVTDDEDDAELFVMIATSCILLFQANMRKLMTKTNRSKVLSFLTFAAIASRR